MNEEEKERLIKKDIVSIENRVRHAFNQGYEMGLKERQNTCEDAISREDALMALTGEWTDSTDELIHRFIRRIKTLPPVKPQYTEDEIQKMQDLEQAEIEKAYELGKAVQPKTGHWIFDEILDKHYYCSECKSMGVDYWDYCPYCGAKMKEGD